MYDPPPKKQVNSITNCVFRFPNHVWLPSYLLFNVPVWSAILVIIIIIMRYNTVYTFCKSSPSDYF